MTNKVELIDWYGGDKAIARAAWTSTSTDVEAKSDEQIRDLLVNKLWNNGTGKAHKCYDDKTEVLTKRGFVLFSELDNDDYVCAVDHKSHKWTFEKPLEVVSYDYDDDMYYVEAKHLDIAVTKGHRLLTSKRSEIGGLLSYGSNWDIETPEDVCGKSRKYLISAVNDNKDTLDPSFAKLIGFFLGDGNCKTPTRISFHLKKERKIKYLKSLGYNISDLKHDTYAINGTNFDFTKCYDKDKNKIIPFDIYSLGRKDIENILDGLINSDGSEKGRGYEEYTFTSTSEPLVEQLKIIACLNGFVFNENKQVKNVKRCLFSHRISPEISNMESRQVGKDEWKKYSGKVYCASVSTGFMMVRRNGKPVVCGNTPFERGIVEFNITADVASHIHIIKHRHLSVNGESARYKELKEDRYLLPQDWDGIRCSDELHSLFGNDWLEILESYTKLGNDLYHKAVNDLTPTLGRKRAKESARYFKTYNSQITLSVMTNMSCFHNFYTLRADDAAQLEIQDIANQMLDCIKGIEGNPFKYTLEAFGF